MLLKILPDRDHVCAIIVILTLFLVDWLNRRYHILPNTFITAACSAFFFATFSRAAWFAAMSSSWRFEISEELLGAPLDNWRLPKQLVWSSLCCSVMSAAVFSLFSAIELLSSLFSRSILAWTRKWSFWKEFFASEIFLYMSSAVILCLDEGLASSVGLSLAEDFSRYDDLPEDLADDQKEDFSFPDDWAGNFCLDASVGYSRSPIVVSLEGGFPDDDTFRSFLLLRTADIDESGPRSRFELGIQPISGV